MAEQVPPEWHTDEHGNRWRWNGAEWTGPFNEQARNFSGPRDPGGSPDEPTPPRTRQFGLILGLFGGGVVLVLLLIIGALYLPIQANGESIASQAQDSSSEGDTSEAAVGPENMASGGVVFLSRSEVVEGPALLAGESRVAASTERNQLPVDVTVYVDYMCPACGSFEEEYGPVLEAALERGEITLQIYPLNFLDPTSLGSNYSTRAANAVSCVVDAQPFAAFDLHTRLLSEGVQPSEATKGLSDGELIELAVDAGAEDTSRLRDCVASQTFANFVSENTRVATEEGVLGLAEGAQLLDAGTGELQDAGGPQVLTSTPLVIVAGEQWDPQRGQDLDEVLTELIARAD